MIEVTFEEIKEALLRVVLEDSLLDINISYNVVDGTNSINAFIRNIDATYIAIEEYQIVIKCDSYNIWIKDKNWNYSKMVDGNKVTYFCSHGGLCVDLMPDYKDAWETV